MMLIKLMEKKIPDRKSSDLQRAQTLSVWLVPAGFAQEQRLQSEKV